MLIKVKNGNLYREWLSYYEDTHSDLMPAEQRTMAFINSNKGLLVPN